MHYFVRPVAWWLLFSDGLSMDELGVEDSWPYNGIVVPGVSWHAVTYSLVDE